MATKTLKIPVEKKETNETGKLAILRKALQDMRALDASRADARRSKKEAKEKAKEEKRTEEQVKIMTDLIKDLTRQVAEMNALKEEAKENHPVTEEK